MADTLQTTIEQNVQDCSSRAISWTIHPLFEKCLRSVCVVFFLIGILSFVYQMTTSMVWVGLSLLIFAISLRQFFLPTAYFLYDDYVLCRCLFFEKRKKWEQIKNYYIDKNGVFLSPYERPSRLENLHGLYLIGANHRPDAMAFIREKLGDTETQ